MATKYFCAHCDQEFTPERPETKPRCPKCMRRGGVEAVSETPADQPTNRRVWIAVAVAVALLGVGFAVYRAQVVSLEEAPPLRPLTTRELDAYLERDQVKPGPYTTLLALPADPGEWPSDPTELARRLHAESSRWSLERVLPRSVYTVDETLGAMAASDERIELYPAELASTMVALLRRSGANAMLAEAWELGDDRAPADPSGMLGYFLVALVDPVTGEPSAYFDPWGGRGELTPKAARVLRDTEAIAAAVGIQAARVYSRSGDGAEALQMIETALALDPRSPSVRVVHSTVLAESGGLPQALAELESAIQLRSDGPRMLNMAQLRLARAGMLGGEGQVGAAEHELAQADRILGEVIAEWPRYGRAHLTLATVLLGTGDVGRAVVELDTAEELAPDSPMLWAVRAQYHLSVGELDAASSAMTRAIALDPENWQLRVQAVGILLGAGDEAAAQANADEALRLVAPARKDKLRAYLDDMLGTPDLALPDPAPTPATDAPDEGDEPALMLGDPSNLKLRDPGQKLQLDIDD